MTTPYRLREEPAREMIVAEPTKQLGRLRSAHDTNRTVRRAGLAAGSIALVLGVTALAWPAAVAFVAIGFLVAAVAATWVGFAVLLGMDVTVNVHENGLRIERSARRAERIPFDAVRALYVVSRSEWALELEDRTVYVPMKVADERRLAAVIEQEIEKPVLRDAHRALSSAEPLTFGELTLELEGIRHAGDVLPWSDLDVLGVTDDAFVFKRKATQHAFLVLRTSSVPFPRVLIALVARRADIESEDEYWTRFC